MMKSFSLMDSDDICTITKQIGLQLAQQNMRCRMRKVLIVPLMLLLLGIGLMDIACDKEEKGTRRTQGVTPQVGAVQTLKAQTTDALSGKPVNRNIYADYEGKRIYFCCEQSRNDFNKNPDVYLTKFREQGVILEVVSTER